MTGITSAELDSRELVSAIKSIKADLKKTRAAIAQLVDEAAQKEEIVRSLERLIRKKGNSNENSKSSGLKKEPAYQMVTRLAREFMIQEAQPLDRHKVLLKITAAGFGLKAKNPLQLVAKTLWASDYFIPTNLGYWPIELPLPQGALPLDRRKSQ
ncbi:MAG: hypothetical protein ACOH2J_09865 [Allorhizobium sp.]